MEQQYSTLLEIPLSFPLPEVILLDAFGTLFGVRDSVGHIYSEIAHKYGVNCPPEVLNKYFYAVFKNSSPCTFPEIALDDIPQAEYQWWREINRQTFTAAGVWSQFADFDLFFDELYSYFATSAAWVVYPDVIPALVNWGRSGIALGILSNFDSRLYTVLKVLDLDRYFSTITISSQANAAKPQPEIFTVALTKHQCLADRTWHIGDSLEDDYLGASAVGINAIWLNRH